MRALHGARLCAVLALLGLGLAGYLGVLHLGLLRGELLGGAVCGTGPFNCHAVTEGSWGDFLGMPLAFWGVIGYIAVLGAALFGLQSVASAERALPAIFALAGISLVIDAVLFARMVFVIRTYCVFCLLTYAVNLGLLGVARWALGSWRRALGGLGAAVAALVPSGREPAAWLFWGLLLVGMSGVVAVHAAATYVSQGTLASPRERIREFVAKQSPVQVDRTGDPAIGPAAAPIEIVEFSDFFCPACRRASRLNAIILANHRRDVVFAFKHYPLDMSCNSHITRVVHPGACQLAAASECAHLQGRFWAFHDAIFARDGGYNPADLEEDVARLGLDVPRFQACLASGQGMEAVKRDIAEAGRHKVGSTPTYFINGLPMPGGMTPAVFEELVAILRAQP